MQQYRGSCALNPVQGYFLPGGAQGCSHVQTTGLFSHLIQPLSSRHRPVRISSAALSSDKSGYPMIYHSTTIGLSPREINRSVLCVLYNVAKLTRMYVDDSNPNPTKENFEPFSFLYSSLSTLAFHPFEVIRRSFYGAIQSSGRAIVHRTPRADGR